MGSSPTQGTKKFNKNLYKPMFKNMLINLLAKITPILGKYFRFVCIIGFPAFVLFLTWFIFFDSYLGKLPLDVFIIGIWVFLILLVIFQISYLRYSHQQRIKGNPSFKLEYEAWGAYLYILIGFLIIYFSLRIISQWIGFDILSYLKRNFF